MTDNGWRKRQRDRNLCLHCNNTVAFDGDKKLTLCTVHLEIQRKLSQRFIDDRKRFGHVK